MQMTDWQAVWKRLNDGEHAVLCGVGPIVEPDPARICLSWVDCEAHPEPGGTIEAARCRIDRDLDVSPWLHVAAQRLRTGLRRHLLGDDHEDLERAVDQRVFRRAPPAGTGPRRALLLSGVDRADSASLERLTRLFASEHPPTWPLVLRFDAREPTGPARALLDQLRRVLPPEAFFVGAERGAGAGSEASGPAVPQLSREAMRVLRAAATIGDRFEIETVAELLGVDELAVLDAIQEALDRGLELEDRGHGIFRFEARAGAALRASTLPALANAWHRRLAELFGGLPPSAAAPSPPSPPAVTPRWPAPARSASPSPSAGAAEPEDAGRDEARSARHAEAAGMRESAAQRYALAATTAASAGRHALALDAAGRALALAEGMAPPARAELEARALLVIAQCRWQAQGAGQSLDGAIEALELARDRAAARANLELQAQIAALIANVCYDIGTPAALERALAEITRASQLWLDARRPVEAARLINDEAAIWAKRGDTERANQLLTRSREIFEKLAQSHPEARLELLETEHLMARLTLRSAPLAGREREAWLLGIEHVRAAEEGYRALGEQRQLGRVCETLGQLKARLGWFDEAIASLEQAQQLQRETGDAIGLARSAGALSDVLAAARDYPRALRSLGESFAFNRQKGSTAGLEFNLESLRRLEERLPAELADQARDLGQQVVHALSAS